MRWILSLEGRVPLLTAGSRRRRALPDVGGIRGWGEGRVGAPRRRSTFDYPRNRVRICCGAVFTWASMAIEVCWMMPYFVAFTCSAAMSAFMIRL